MRFRGGYNRATRAPNLGELYLPLQQIFTGGGVYGDPCGLLSNSPFGSGGALVPEPTTAEQRVRRNTEHTLTTLAPARRRRRAERVPDLPGADGYDGCELTSTATTNAQPGARRRVALLWINQIGNPNLESEKAKTYTAGVVLRSPFEHPLLSRFTATVDWYKINIDDAILPYSIDYARFLCYGAVLVTNAAEAAAQAACHGLPERAPQPGDRRLADDAACRTTTRPG